MELRSLLIEAVRTQPCPLRAQRQTDIFDFPQDDIAFIESITTFRDFSATFNAVVVGVSESAG
jgi:hypothetical protein